MLNAHASEVKKKFEKVSVTERYIHEGNYARIHGTMPNVKSNIRWWVMHSVTVFSNTYHMHLCRAQYTRVLFWLRFIFRSALSCLP